MNKEFFDLADHQLNGESNFTTHWGNFGYWQVAETYPQACEALAELVGEAAQLNEYSNLLDIGFGSGEQILYWLQKYNVPSIVGFNISHSQTEFAKQKMITSNFTHNKTIELLQGESNSFRYYYDDKSRTRPNSIIALDCAYHFQNRKSFFQNAHDALLNSGRLVLTDFGVLNAEKHQGSVRNALFMKPIHLMAKASQIPTNNLITIDLYIEQLQQAGFSEVQVKNLSSDIFPPFLSWLKQYKRKHFSNSRLNALKYDVTANFLAWSHRHSLLQYYLIVAQK